MNEITQQHRLASFESLYTHYFQNGLFDMAKEVAKDAAEHGFTEQSKRWIKQCNDTIDFFEDDENSGTVINTLYERN